MGRMALGAAGLDLKPRGYEPIMKSHALSRELRTPGGWGVGWRA